MRVARSTAQIWPRIPLLPFRFTPCHTSVRSESMACYTYMGWALVTYAPAAETCNECTASAGGLLKMATKTLRTEARANSGGEARPPAVVKKSR